MVDLKHLLRVAPLVVALGVAVGCSDMATRNRGRYRVEGAVADTAWNGTVVDITIPLVEGVQDSTVIRDGKFSMKGRLPANTIYQVRIRNKRVSFAATEQEKVMIEYPRQGGYKIAAGEQSLALYELTERVNAATRRFMLLSRNIGDDELVNDEYLIFKDEMESMLTQSIEQNAESILGVYGVWQYANYMKVERTTQLDSLATRAAMAAECPIIVAYRERLERLEATGKGHEYADFEAENMAGESVRLSDYVGRDGYLLVYVWSSLLSSCWSEVEYVKANYERFENRGLKVLAVNIFDKPHDFKYIAESEGAPWDVVRVERGRDLMALYGTRSVPLLLLIDKDGTIVERGMRGEETATLLEQLMPR